MAKAGKLVEERRLKKLTCRRTMKAPVSPDASRKEGCVYNGLTRAQGCHETVSSTFTSWGRKTLYHLREFAPYLSNHSDPSKSQNHKRRSLFPTGEPPWGSEIPEQREDF